MKNLNYSFIYRYNQAVTRMFFLSLVMMILLIISSCTIHEFGTEPDGDKIKIEGSGDLITEVVEVPYYHSVLMNTAGLVNIVQGDEQQVKVTVDENILEYVNIFVNNDELNIEVDHRIILSDYELTIDVIMTGACYAHCDVLGA